MKVDAQTSRLNQIEQKRDSFLDFCVEAVENALMISLENTLVAFDDVQTTAPKIGDEMQTAIASIYSLVMPFFADAVYNEFAPMKNVEDWLSDVQTFVLLNAPILAHVINDTTNDELTTILSAVAVMGLSLSAAVAEIRRRFTDIVKTRAERIARTEIVSASNEGQILGANRLRADFGFVLEKTWVAVLDNRTRQSHRNANGKTVAFDDFFIIEGERLKQPCDRLNGATAKNTINCRCTVSFKRVEL